MATNIVSMVMQYLTPDTIGKVSTALGLDRSKTQAAIGAAVPGLLAGFSSVAARPAAAQQLADAAAQQAGALDGFSGALTGSGQTSGWIEKGSQMLSSLLGSGNESALAGAVGGIAGLGRGAGASLLGMLAPLVMGTIAKQLGPRNLDGQSVGNFLAGQKDNIAAALPSGFADLVGGTGMLDSLGDAARTAGAAGTAAARGAVSATHAAGDAGRRAAVSASRWLYWAIPVLAVAAVAIYLLTRPAPDEPLRLSEGSPQSLVVDGVDIGDQLTQTVSGLRMTLTSITDTASAQRALPRLQEINTQIDRVAGLKGQLSGPQQTALGGMVSSALPTLTDLSSKALAIPGVAEVLKPTLDAMTAKLAALAA
jgi:hypothetical protein